MVHAARVLLVTALIAALPGCSQKADQSFKGEEASRSVISKPDRNPPPELPTKEYSTATLIEYLKGPAPDHPGWAQARAMAIDILAERKTGEAIPYLIECLADYRGLTGSDNWVGGHAASALSAITGRPFSVDQGEWRKWWTQEPRR